MHVAIIMDGNGRWATGRGLPRLAGHRAGAAAVRRAVEAAPGLGIDVLTLYAFSSDNWRRPGPEVTGLMRLFERHLRGETKRLVANGVRLKVIGRRDRLPEHLLRAIDRAEQATAGGKTLRLRIAVDYSSRDSICQAAESLCRRSRLRSSPTCATAVSAVAPPPPDQHCSQSSGTLADGTDSRDCGPHRLNDREEMAALLAEAVNDDRPAPDVDLLIRTGGECRLSDFLLWESAYAELHFTDRMWPDFNQTDLAAAIDWFKGRQRRFGALPATVRKAV